MQKKGEQPTTRPTMKPQIITDIAGNRWLVIGGDKKGRSVRIDTITEFYYMPPDYCQIVCLDGKKIEIKDCTYEYLLTLFITGTPTK